MSRPTTRGRAAALVLLVALAVGGCAVPTDESPRAVAEEYIPEQLVAAPTTTTAPSDGGPRVELFFVESVDGINELRREPAVLEDAKPTTVVEALVASVPEELPEGVTSSIPADTQVLGVTLEDGTLTVDLSEEFQTVSGEPLILAVAQIVFTASAMPAVEDVAFRIEGEPITVPDAEGTELDRPARRSDYVSLLADAS